MHLSLSSKEEQISPVFLYKSHSNDYNWQALFLELCGRRFPNQPQKRRYVNKKINKLMSATVGTGTPVCPDCCRVCGANVFATVSLVVTLRRRSPSSLSARRRAMVACASCNCRISSSRDTLALGSGESSLLMAFSPPLTKLAIGWGVSLNELLDPGWAWGV